MEELYRMALPIVAYEARRAGVLVDDALSLASILVCEIGTRYRSCGEDAFGLLFRKSLRRALRDSVRRMAREVPVDPFEVLEAVKPDGQPVADVEARIWWEQVLESADLSPREREAAEALGDSVFWGEDASWIPRWLLCRVRRKLRRAVAAAG